MSNGRYKSGEHRATMDMVRTRLSWPVFAEPNLDHVVGPLPELVVDDAPKFKPYVYREYKFLKMNKLPLEIETTPLPLLLDAGKARGRRRREICYIFLMVSLALSQSSRLVSCFALTQSVSLDLVPSKLEQTFVVSAQVFKTTGTASFTGVSRKSCTRSTFHLLPYSEFALHMCFRLSQERVA
ncbi:hypothetical protein YC2023_026059 [Brassica napus]